MARSHIKIPKISIGQKLRENTKFEKFKCDILRDFCWQKWKNRMGQCPTEPTSERQNL